MLVRVLWVLTLDFGQLNWSSSREIPKCLFLFYLFINLTKKKFESFWQLLENNLKNIVIFFSSNSARKNQIPWENCFPPYDYVYYLCITKHGLSVRSTCYLSEARAVITPEAHAKWAKLIEEVIFSQPEIMEAFQDPRRIFNNVSCQITWSIKLGSFVEYFNIKYCRLSDCSRTQYFRDWYTIIYCLPDLFKLRQFLLKYLVLVWSALRDWRCISTLSVDSHHQSLLSDCHMIMNELIQGLS